MFDLFAKPKLQKSTKTCAFIFDWDAEDSSGAIVGIIRDIPLKDYEGKPERGSSLLREELSVSGWDAFFDMPLNVSGRYRWEGTYWARQDYDSDWDSGWDVISFEPANKRTRKAVLAYGDNWN